MVPDTSQKNFFRRPIQKVIKKMVATKGIPGQHYPGQDHTRGLRETEGIFSHRKVPRDIRKSGRTPGNPSADRAAPQSARHSVAGPCSLNAVKSRGPSIRAWRIPWTEELGGLQSLGSQRVGHD